MHSGGVRDCRPVDGPLSASASTASMSGDYALTMVATGGARDGRSVEGRISLHPQDSALVALEGATQPLVGTAEIALETVGAVLMGDLTGADGRGPGVGVYEQRPAGAAPTVVVRLGSVSNARGPAAFDAGHTTLYVRRIGEGAFAGGWASGAGSVSPPQESRGYFCAVRAGP